MTIMAYGTNSESKRVHVPTPGGSWRSHIQAVFGALPSSRTRWFALAAMLVAAGLAFNWSWLVAIGVAPTLVAALPCVAMCALGLCMNRKNGRAQAKEPADAEHPSVASSGCCAGERDTKIEAS
jgi:hypothetical protein